MSAPSATPAKAESIPFDEFVRRVDAAVRGAASAGGVETPDASHARWQAGGRDVVLVATPPRNVSVTLGGRSVLPGPATTWYPVDNALVPVVAQRIAAHLGTA
ncbi:MAG TPA: hypothetical protein VHS78_14835 [Candidatus Elarobacter sp.]|jgi:hypothetical protein|nr:hypothetical protein [Candidatus Elarobacter sp.]